MLVAQCLLGTQLFTEENQIKSTLFSKLTDSHSYVHYHSQHPKICKSNIPYSQMLSVHRIFSSTTDFGKYAEQMEKNTLSKDLYPQFITSLAHTRAHNSNRKLLLEHKQKETDTRIPLIFTCNQNINESYGQNNSIPI